MTSSANTASKPLYGQLFMGFGLGFAALGIGAFVAQVALERLIVPWYMPALAAVGVVCVGISLAERRTVWRLVALAVVVLLTGAELALLNAMRLPPYTGPIVVGRAFPPFEAKRADGTAFTERDLAGDQNSVLVFFRGRW